MILLRPSFVSRWGAVAAFVLTAAIAQGAAVVESQGTTFTAADGTRNYLDVGGVWNGSTNVGATTGDAFTLELENSGTTEAFDLSATVTLPVGFTLVGSATGVASSGGNPTVTATQVGTTVTFDTSGYDLPAGATLTYNFGLRAESTLADGTYQLSYEWQFAPTDGGTLGAVQDTQQNVLVQTGAWVATNSPTTLTLAVNESGSFTYTITNTGLGGLFDVAFSEVLSNPGTSWDFTNFGTITAPRSTTLSDGNATVTIPYLAPGEELTVVVNGSVTDCFGIENEFEISDLTGVRDGAFFTPISLDLNQPLLDKTWPTVTLDYGTTTAFSMAINNTGSGSAVGVDIGGGSRAIRLVTNLNTLGVDVSNLAANWSYDAGTGEFRYTGNSSTIPNGDSTTLTFDLQASDECAGSTGGTVIATIFYENDCGTPFGIPTIFGTINAATDAPTLTLQKEASATRLSIGEAGSFTVTLSASNLDKISTTNVVVTDTMPTAATGIATTESTGTVSIAGNVITWTVPVSALSSDQTLDIDFTAPTDPCDGGSSIVNTVSTNTLTTTAGCDLSASASASVLLGNNPGASVTQALDVSPTASDNFFETGAASADGTRDNGEGEFVPIVATYTVGPGYPGEWSGSSYEDDFGGLTGATLVPGTVEVNADSAGWVAVPGGSISGGVGSLTIDLSFLAGASFFNDVNFADAVNTRTLALRYQLTATDADLNGSNTRNVTAIATLSITKPAGSPPAGGACEEAQYEFRQGEFYAIARAAATLGVNMPSQVSVCEEFTVTLTVGNDTVETISNVLTTLITTGDYAYLTGQTPVYGGAFNAGNITYNENGGTNPTFAFTGGDLSSNGTITVTMRRKGGSGTTVSAISATVDYDDNETNPSTGTREFQTTGSDSPLVVREADISVISTPQKVTILDGTGSWRAFVNNGGNGVAESTELLVAYPTGISPNAADIVAANTAIGLTLGDVAIAGSDVTIQLGNLASGEAKEVVMVGELDGSTCTFTSTANAIKARWGCDSVFVETEETSNPVFSQPDGSLQIVHDTTNSAAQLCDSGIVEIIIRNTGLTSVNDIRVSEVVSPGSGLALVMGSVQYSVNGGAFNAASAAYNPSGTGSSGDPFEWDDTQIPEFATLANSLGADPHTVRIRFSITSNETTNGVAPTLTASGTGVTPCSATVSSPGVPFNLPVRKPNITVVTTAINRTAAGGGFATGSFGNTAFGGEADEVEWRVQVTNSGNYVAQNVRFRFDAAGSGGALEIRNSAGTVLNAAYTSGSYETLPDIAASDTVTYYVVETLGGTCVNTNATATVEWGCDASAPYLTSPSDNTDGARLNMIPSFGGSGGGSINHQFTRNFGTVDNGRVRHRITYTNGGGSVRNLVATLTMPDGLDYDSSSPASLFGTSTGNYTGVTVTGTYPTYTFTFTPVAAAPGPDMRNGENVRLEYFLIPLDYDTTANTASPSMAQVASYQMPETAGNSLDPAAIPNADTTIGTSIAFDSTCAAPQTPVTRNLNANPNTPDLDITVTPTSQQFSGTYAPYTYIFDYEITNVGENGSMANNIVFSLPTVGPDWASISAELIQPGTGGTAGTVTTAPYDTLDIGRLGRNQSAIVQVTAATNAAGSSPTSAGLVLVGQVEGSLFDQSGADTGNNYSLDRAAPTIGDDFNLSGYLYVDEDHDLTRDGSETGIGSGTRFAKIIDLAAPGVAVKATSIDAATGFYLFTEVVPASYRIIVDDNNTLADVTPLASISGYVGTEMPDLERLTTVGITSVVDQNFGVFQGSVLTGTVFVDTGTGGGTANDGTKQAGELGIGGVTMTATDNAGTTYDTAVTGGDGVYQLWIPSTATIVAIEEAQPGAYQSIGGNAGTTGGTYSLPNDETTFTATAGTSYTGVDFGEVPANTFLNDGAQSILPGATATYPHVFTAGTAGKVSFAPTSSATPALDGWSEVMYLDANGNGEGDAAETIITSADVFTVAADEVVNIVIKQFSPIGAPLNARNNIEVAAQFTATSGGSDVLVYDDVIRQDVTTVGAGGSDGLDIAKAVDKTTAAPDETITYTITYVNNGSAPLNNVVIYDSVPAWTVYESAAGGTPPAGLTGPTITAPSVGADEGAIVWTFGGELTPGASGEVTFSVKVQQ